jgi:hypothetical protein
MKRNLFDILRALSREVLIECVDLPEFGFSAPLCVITKTWVNVPVDYGDVLALEKEGYIALIDKPKPFKSVYQITVGGMLALTA